MVDLCNINFGRGAAAAAQTIEGVLRATVASK
jgi:hypothetical protein